MTTDTAMGQAKAQLEHIGELMARVKHASECDGDADTCSLMADWMGQVIMNMDIDEYHDSDAAQQAIDEKPLSVEVRSGWYSVGQYVGDDNDIAKPVEYQILLCTGGPAVRIIGELDNYGEPDSARLEYQDWGTPWTEYYPQTLAIQPADGHALLLNFARQFYYGG